MRILISKYIILLQRSSSELFLHTWSLSVEVCDRFLFSFFLRPLYCRCNFTCSCRCFSSFKSNFARSTPRLRTRLRSRSLAARCIFKLRAQTRRPRATCFSLRACGSLELASSPLISARSSRSSPATRGRVLNFTACKAMRTSEIFQFYYRNSTRRLRNKKATI